MASESGLINLIENFPLLASFKAADTGKYLFSNRATAHGLGVGTPRIL